MFKKSDKNQKKILFFSLSIVGITSLSLLVWKTIVYFEKKDTDQNTEILKIPLPVNKEKIFEKANIEKDNKKSFGIYGNLFDPENPIKIDYYKNNYTFQIGDKNPIVGLNNFNNELDKQGDTEVTNYTIENLSNSDFDLINFDIENKTWTRAKAKKTSIDNYGYFQNQTIEVDWNGTEYTFQIDENTKITSLNDLITELNKQTENELSLDTEFDTLDNLVFSFSDIAHSIKDYGNLFASDASIKVDYQENTGFIFWIDHKTKIFSLSVFNKELNIQKKDNSKELDFTIENLINGDSNLNFENLKYIEKLNSIKTYGDLKNDLIEVDYNGTNYTFQIGDETIIIGFDAFNTELNNQGDIEVTPYTIQNLISEESDLNFDAQKSPQKAKTKFSSIETYGDLFAENTSIKVDWNETDEYTFQIDDNTQIIGLLELNRELNNQSDEIVFNYTMEDLRSQIILKFDNLLNAKVKAGISEAIPVIKKNSLESANISSDINIENIESTTNPENEITIQTSDESEDLEAKISAANIKTNSINLYGNLKTELIKVDYEDEDYTFQIDGKDQIIGLSKLNTELDNQGDKRLKPYTIEDLTSARILNFDNIKTLERAKSIKEYGDLAIENDYSYRFENNKINLYDDWNDKLIFSGSNKINEERKKQNLKILNFDSSWEEEIGQSDYYDGFEFFMIYGDLKKIKIYIELDLNRIRYKIYKKGIENLWEFVDFDIKPAFEAQYPEESFETDFNFNNPELDFYFSKIASIKIFGDLLSSNASIKVDYNGTNYTFQIGDNTQIIGITNLNKQLNFQKNQNLEDYKYTEINQLLTSELNIHPNYTILDATDKLQILNKVNELNDLTEIEIILDESGNQLLFRANDSKKFNLSLLNEIIRIKNYDFETSTWNEYLKQKSILEYGNLKASNASIKVDYNGTKYTFQIGENTKIIVGLENLNIELDNQGDQVETPYTIENFSDSNLLSFDTLYKTWEKAKAKKASIENYGDLTKAIVTNSNAEDKGLVFTVETKIAINSESEFDTQFAIQYPGAVLATEKAKLTGYTKNKSIETYGDLKTATVTLNGSNELVFTVGTKAAINETIFNKQSKLQNNFFYKTRLPGYQKALSFKVFGDLKTATVNLSTEDETLQFIVTGKDPINETTFDNEFAIQYPGDNLDIEKNKLANYIKNKSIETFGNLTVQTIEVDWDSAYTFQIAEKYNFITGINVFNKELSKQTNETINYSFDELINGNSELNFDVQKSLAKAKTKKTSIQTYGDLWHGENIIIKVIWEVPGKLNSENFEFKPVLKIKINEEIEPFSIEVFKEELIKQDYTKENLINSFNWDNLTSKETDLNNTFKENIISLGLEFDDAFLESAQEKKQKYYSSVDTYGKIFENDWLFDFGWSFGWSSGYYYYYKRYRDEMKWTEDSFIHQYSDKKMSTFYDLIFNIQQTDTTITNLQEFIDFISNKQYFPKDNIKFHEQFFTQLFGDWNGNEIKIIKEEENYTFQIEGKEKIYGVKNFLFLKKWSSVDFDIDMELTESNARNIIDHLLKNQSDLGLSFSNLTGDNFEDLIVEEVTNEEEQDSSILGTPSSMVISSDINFNNDQNNFYILFSGIFLIFFFLAICWKKLKSIFKKRK